MDTSRNNNTPLRPKLSRIAWRGFLLGLAIGALVAVTDTIVLYSGADYLRWRDAAGWSYVLWPAQVLLFRSAPRMSWGDLVQIYGVALSANGILYGLLAVVGAWCWRKVNRSG